VKVLPRLAALVGATHPIPAVSVTALVAALTVARRADPFTVWWAVASTAAGQASVGWSNDYLDRFEDARAGRSEKPVVSGGVPPEVVGRAAATAFPVSIALSVPLGFLESAIMALAVSTAWLYNLGLKRTVLSWAPYAVSFGLLPAYVWVATGSLPTWWLVGAAALLGVAAHLTNVVPDLQADSAAGHRGLPHRLGPRGSLLTACGLLLVVLAVVLVGSGAWRSPNVAQAVAAVLAGGLILWVYLAVRRGAAKTGFYLTIAAAAAIATVLVLSWPQLPR
jgi:4-hydroxybenzoate polyprenyltransferase